MQIPALFKYGPVRALRINVARYSRVRACELLDMLMIFFFLNQSAFNSYTGCLGIGVIGHTKFEDFWGGIGFFFLVCKSIFRLFFLNIVAKNYS